MGPWVVPNLKHQAKTVFYPSLGDIKRSRSDFIAKQMLAFYSGVLKLHSLTHYKLLIKVKFKILNFGWNLLGVAKKKLYNCSLEWIRFSNGTY